MKKKSSEFAHIFLRFGEMTVRDHSLVSCVDVMIDVITSGCVKLGCFRLANSSRLVERCLASTRRQKKRGLLVRHGAQVAPA